MTQKPSIPKGTRDFTPDEMVKRNYIFDTIKEVFRNYGYQSIETPAMENLSTLLGKYGEEGDRLLFKVLNSGDFLKNVDQSAVEESRLNEITSAISEKGLRYDLTVPFARYVVQHRNEITFPFKRFQVQPVWRADRPQRGRYREFYQCDVDVIGSDSLLNEVELIKMIDDIFTRLQIRVTIKLNSRKILSGISDMIDAPEKLTVITTAIDKLDKTGLDQVVNELLDNGLQREKIDQIIPLIQLEGSNPKKLEKLSKLLSESKEGEQGVQELKEVLSYLQGLKIRSKIEVDQSLARGLNYYTGAIIEVKANDVSIGSICGGGRYDNLTGIFGLPDVSGVGVSFGADRIYDVLNELGLFPDKLQSSTDVLLANFGEKEARFCLKVIEVLQDSGIRAELYPEAAKMKKQMKYADLKSVKFVLLIGEEEIKTGLFSLKLMKTGDQIKGKLSELIKRIKNV
jgi:histidyl-tRNA synthetase